MVEKVKRGEERWKIVRVYIDKGEIVRVQDLQLNVEEWTGNRKESIKTVGGNFNMRIGKEDRGDKGNQVFRICDAKKWWTKRIC